MKENFFSDFKRNFHARLEHEYETGSGIARKEAAETMWSGIAVFYLICTSLGFLFALIGAIFGELGSHMHFHVGGDHVNIGGAVNSADGFDSADHGGAEAGAVGQGDMPGASVFNTITVSTFIGFFGISGLIGVWIIRLSDALSLIFALPISLLLAAVEFALYLKIFIHAQASSEATLYEVLGCEATVIASIPGDRIGQISYSVKGSRFTAPATSADGEDIPRGSKVRVVNAKGAVLVVRLV